MKALTLLAALLLIGCGGENLDSNPDVMAMLPEGAERVFDAGNGWVTFDYGGAVLLVSPTGGIADVGKFRRVPVPADQASSINR